MPSFFYEAINSYLEQNVHVRTSTQNKQTQKNPKNKKMLPLSSQNFCFYVSTDSRASRKTFLGVAMEEAVVGSALKT